MGGSPCCPKEGQNRGAWTAQEDQILSEYIKSFGEGRWRTLPKNAGLKRCGKSCRLRWLNYLRPDIKRGNISDEEEELIIRMHKLLGNRWSLIAGRLPGRTDNEIKNYWNTILVKKLQQNQSPSLTPQKRSTPRKTKNPARKQASKRQRADGELQAVRATAMSSMDATNPPSSKPENGSSTAAANEKEEGRTTSQDAASKQDQDFANAVMDFNDGSACDFSDLLDSELLRFDGKMVIKDIENNNKNNNELGENNFLFNEVMMEELMGEAGTWPAGLDLEMDSLCVFLDSDAGW